MKDRKYLVAAGLPAADVDEITLTLRSFEAQLEHAWAFAREDDEIDFVLADLADFGGRCARIRALDEGRHLAVVANPGDDTLGVPLVLTRPLSARALLDALNHVGKAIRPSPRRLIDVGISEGPSIPVRRDASNEARNTDPDGRACFLDIQRERPCTDLDALIKRGAVLLQREGLQPLLVDPVMDTFHTPARMRELEPYFLEPVTGHERRRVSGKQLAALRAQYEGRPLQRLRWLNALLRSNGWLSERLDPSASFRLVRWFELGAEYRKQRRIALALMRGGPLHRIASSAHARMADVFDVVNAFHALDLLAITPQQKVPERRKGKGKGGKNRAGPVKRASRALTAAFLP